jgi:hypothetical protein
LLLPINIKSDYKLALYYLFSELLILPHYNQQTLKMYTKLIVALSIPLVFGLFQCNSKKISQDESFEEPEAPVVTVTPKVVEKKDTFNSGEPVSAKIYMERTDYKTLALQHGIKNYMEVFYYHGGHLGLDSLDHFQKAEVEFDTAYIQFNPKSIKSDFDVVAYPYDVVIKIDYTNDRDGADTTFVWREEAFIKKG